METTNVAISNKLTSLFNTIRSAFKNQNTITSPLCIFSCFALLAEGTTGETFKELQSAFGYESHPTILPQDMNTYLRLLLTGKTNSVLIRMDNSIYSSISINTQYIETLQSKYLSLAKTVDFSDPNTVVDINNRITECTNGLLKDTISQLSADTVCVLVNTIYFKGDWKEAFDKSLTSKGVFKAADGEKHVDFMHHSKLKCGYLEAESFVYLAIPYQGGAVKFVIQMRGDGVIGDSDYNNVVSAANKNEEKCDVKIPKFKASFKTQLNDILKTLGVNGIFKSSPDFQKISDQSIAVSEVIHQAFIQVDEVGTEAAAATVIVMARSMEMPRPTPVFVADRPFQYHIVDTTNNLVLFSGSISEPKF